MVFNLMNNRFLFEELIKRDFKKKYKRTLLGVVWCVLSPLLMLLVMRLIFTRFFGNGIPFYTTYLFAGQVVFSYFTEATNGGMNSLLGNSGIFTKVKAPKYLFLLSKNVTSFINFFLTLMLFLVFAAVDGVIFDVKYFLLLYPVLCLVLFNIGVGLILSTLFIMFKDIEYLYRVLTQVMMYFSAIFYNINAYPKRIQYLFYLNPLYVYICYFRKIVIENIVPQLGFHLLCAFYAITVLFIGALIYKKYNHKFLYYV